MLLTAGYDGLVKAWHSANLNPAGLVYDQTPEPISAFTPLRSRAEIMLASPSGKIDLIDLGTGKRTSGSSPGLECIDRIACDALKGIAYLSGQDFSAESVSLADLSHIAELRGTLEDDLVDICLSKDGELLFMATVEGTLSARDARTGRMASRLFINTGGITSLAIHPDEDSILVGGFGVGQVRSYEIDTMKCTCIWEITREIRHRESMEGPRAPVSAICALPDAKGIVFGDGDGNICIGSPHEEDILEYWKNRNSFVNAIEASPHGSHVAIGYRDGYVESYDTDSWELEASVCAHDGPIVGMGFAADMDLLLETHSPTDSSDITLHRYTKNCRECQEEIECIYWFCPKCYSRIEGFRCPRCRAKVDSVSDKYFICHNCGYRRPDFSF